MTPIFSWKEGPLFFGLLCVLIWGVEAWTRRETFSEKARHSFVNLSLFSAKVLIQFSLGWVVADRALWSRETHFGLLYRVDLPETARFIAAFVILDLLGYWLHRISHLIPVLWRLHRVHHTDEKVDVSTYFRTHPGEALFQWIWFVGVVTVLAPPIAAIELSILVTLFSALFQHAELKLPAGLDRLLSKIWISGRLHHIHHSTLQRETDSNYGPLFSFWDRMFGSFCEGVTDPLRYGLVEFSGAKWRTLGAALLTPFVAKPGEIYTHATGTRDARPG